MNPGVVILQLAVGGCIWWFILGAILKNDQVEISHFILWFGVALLVGLAVDFIGGKSGLAFPAPVVILLRILAKTLTLFVFLRLEFSAWDIRRIRPARFWPMPG